MKKNTIIAVLILSVLAVGIFYYLIRGNIGEKYNTVLVEKGEVEKFVDELGTISSKNVRNYYGNNISKVEKIDLELGDYVKKGQLLIKYEDNIDFEIQKVEKQVEALRANYNEELSGADSEKVNNAKIEIAKIKSSIALENKNKNRIQELYEN